MINLVQKEGIMTGHEFNQFRPNEFVTRAQFATVADRWSDHMGKDITTPYTDISHHWAMSSIQAMYDLGWMSGFNDNTFRPNENMTRAQAVKVLNQMFDRPLISNVLKSKWTDIPNSH
ncbi:S-layer homology domain-containing protein [Paenalkalicoccus suaedae]|uniref:S-layer homology domain-containing protein n=1 Tax=Paenalkalicoccus suaedae TaxID=2592382 RepID=A0A859FKM6_9BACI|nr:S-layer homology domain-containing protein [Paenalkalicoccus suaedae]QKS73343.1 S-layer homology domain-containing protein [Paenalkalicoccus suaedae]